VEGVRPVTDAVCEVMRVVFRAVVWPYEVVKPYSICVSADSFVSHEAVNEDSVTFVVWIFEMVGGVASENVAVTLFMPSIVMKHEPVPEHAPDQPEKREPDDGEAVRVIDEPVIRVSTQSVPQEMPEGDDDTVPCPVPIFVTVKAYEGLGRAHEAVVPPFEPVQFQR